MYVIYVVKIFSFFQGMVFQRTVEGSVTSKEKAKVAVYSCPFDVTTTETKGTVLIHTADELASFSRGEENKMEEDVSSTICR